MFRIVAFVIRPGAIKLLSFKLGLLVAVGCELAVPARKVSSELRTSDLHACMSRPYNPKRKLDGKIAIR